MTRARLPVTMARSYQGLGIYDSARGLYARALATFRDQSGEATVAARALKDSVASALEASDPEGAERDLADALALLRDLGDGAGIEAAYAHAAAAMSLGNLLRPSEADLHYAWLAAARAHLFDADPGFFAEMSLLHADSEAANRRPERAVEVGREAVALTARAFGERSPVHARALVALAGALTDTRRYAEAEQRYATAVDRLRASLGARHRMVGTTLPIRPAPTRLGPFGEARAAPRRLSTSPPRFMAATMYLVSPLLHRPIYTRPAISPPRAASSNARRALAAVSGYPVYVARVDTRVGPSIAAKATAKRPGRVASAGNLRARSATAARAGAAYHLAASRRRCRGARQRPRCRRPDGLARGIGAETGRTGGAASVVRLQARAAPAAEVQSRRPNSSRRCAPSSPFADRRFEILRHEHRQGVDRRCTSRRRSNSPHARERTCAYGRLDGRRRLPCGRAGAGARRRAIGDAVPSPSASRLAACRRC